MGHMGQPYRESREEGNSRESLPFPSLPLPPRKGREGKVIPALFRSVSTVIVYYYTGALLSIVYYSALITTRSLIIPSSKVIY